MPKPGEELGGVVIRIAALNKTKLSGLDGSFTFTDIPKGKYILTTSCQSYTVFSSEIMVDDAAGVVTLSISLTPCC